METLFFIISLTVFLYSVILHEIAHGWVANIFGDDTAKVSGRLSLNPLVHIDPVGSLFVPALLYLSQSGFMFGWAKPVPVNAFRLKGGPGGYRWVCLAGILTNFLLAIFATIVLKIVMQYMNFGENNLGVLFFIEMMKINLILAIFNLIPLPGFDGFNFLASFPVVGSFIKKTPLGNPFFMAQYGLIISIFLLFLLMPLISSLISTLFSLYLTIFGL